MVKNIRTFSSKILRHRVCRMAPMAFWAVPTLIVIRLIRPWLHIRFGALASYRIGHFVGDSAIYLAQNNALSLRPRTINLFWFSEPSCNDQWARMVRRQLHVYWWVRYLISFNALLPGSKLHQLQNTHGSRDIHGALTSSKSRFLFTQYECDLAKAWLRRRGWKSGEPFVCLLIRDSAYLNKHGTLLGQTDAAAWAYHNYRDSDVTSFVPAVSTLIEKGYWVVRMGQVAHNRFPLEHHRLIDYPFTDDQDHLIDIWLADNCYFFVSTGSGLDAIPTATQSPVVFVNFNPLTQICSYTNCITVPKTLRWRHTGRALTVSEHLDRNFLKSKDYDDHHIDIEPLSSDDIKDAVLECEARLKGEWVDLQEDTIRQNKFWQLFETKQTFSKLHKYIHPNSRLGNKWLRKQSMD